MPTTTTAAIFAARTVGIEMEVTTDRRDGTRNSTGLIAADLRAALSAVTGAQRVNEMGYGHSDGRSWDVKTDSSCGYEVASPAIRLDADGHHAALKAVCDALTAKSRVSRQCGMHVHVDVSDLTTDEFQRFLALYLRYEPFLFSLVAESRRNNHYCRPVRAVEWTRNEPGFDATTWERVMRARTPDALRSAMAQVRCVNDRYHALNLTHYWRTGRIEFRLHHGTTSYNKVRGFVMWLLAMVARAKATHLPAVRKQVAKPLDANVGYGARSGLPARNVLMGLGMMPVASTRANGQSYPDDAAAEMLAWTATRRRALGRGEVEA